MIRRPQSGAPIPSGWFGALWDWISAIDARTRITGDNATIAVDQTPVGSVIRSLQTPSSGGGSGGSVYNGYFAVRRNADSVLYVADGATWDGSTSQASAYYIMGELRTMQPQAVAAAGYVFLALKDDGTGDTYPDAQIVTVGSLSAIPSDWIAFELIAEIKQTADGTLSAIQRWQSGTPRLPVYSTLCQ